MATKSHPEGKIPVINGDEVCEQRNASSLPGATAAGLDHLVVNSGIRRHKDRSGLCRSQPGAANQ